MKTALVVALATALAFAVAGSASAASRTAYETEGAHSTSGGLPPAKLFGTLRRFKVTGNTRETVETAPKGGSITGTHPIRTTTSWTLTFTRLAHRPSGL